ncbi:MAG TPA: signal peptidase II [Clostridiales bacterium]|nr:signal peptidase II [Clostridiales bacterium]
MLELFIILLVIAADQIAKYITVQYLKPLNTISLLEGVLSLTYVENRGAAFGILQNQRWFLIILPLLIVTFSTIYLIKNRKEPLLTRISLAVILGGAIGNLLDRIFRTYVVDMFQFTFIQFPVFNIADMAVVCATIVLALQLLFYKEKSTSDDIKSER